MEKTVMCTLYYFDDKFKRYYFETSAEAECLRFVVYKKYDKQRLTKRDFVVPVSRVGKMLVPKDELYKYPLSGINNNREEKSTTDSERTL